jgi:hypothetical protein
METHHVPTTTAGGRAGGISASNRSCKSAGRKGPKSVGPFRQPRPAGAIAAFPHNG